MNGCRCAVARDLAIDLGTANTVVYAKGRGIVFNEPTVIAVNSRTNDVLAVGHEAWQSIGRAPGHVVAMRPLRRGAISDFDITEKMLRLLLARCGVSRLGRARVLLCVPSAITPVERRAVREAMRRAGASSVSLIEQPMAAAIGAGLAVSEPMGNMVVDVGGGTSESAVLSLGGVVALRTVRCGGFDLDGAIQAHVRREHHVAIAERTAEEIKLAIGSAVPWRAEVKAEVRGRDVLSGMPKTVVITPDEVRLAIEDQVTQIVEAALSCVSEAAPELAQDIMFQGISLVGGGALLKGLDTLLAERTSVPVRRADMPLECVAVGAGRCLESLESLRSLFLEEA